MPRQSFFEDLRKHYVSRECKDRRHSACDGYVPREDFAGHDHECDCFCHLTMAERMRLKARKELNKRWR